MENITQWFSQYWMYAVGFVAVCIGAAFVFRAAGRSYKRYYNRYRSQEAEIKRLLELKEKYVELTEEVIKNADENELLEGTALSYQLVLQKQEDMSAVFAELEKEKRYIYALDVFVQDKSVRTFFKGNGRELTQIIVPAMKLIGLDEAAQKAENMRIMFDEKDETTSISEKVIEETENYFINGDVLTKIKHNAAKYIKNNPNLFI